MKVQIYIGEVTDSIDEMELIDTIDAEHIKSIDKEYEALFIELDNGEQRLYAESKVTLKFA